MHRPGIVAAAFWEVAVKAVGTAVVSRHELPPRHPRGFVSLPILASSAGHLRSALT